MNLQQNDTFKHGDITEDVWAGDLVTKCEFIDDLGLGLMLFRDTTFGGYRAVYRETNGVLNGWTCHSTLKGLKQEIIKKLSL